MGEAIREVVASLEEESFRDQGVGDDDHVSLLARWLQMTTPELDNSRDRAVQILEWSGGPSDLARTPSGVVAGRWGIAPHAFAGFQAAVRYGVLTALAPVALDRVTGSRSVYERFAGLGRHSRESFWVLGLGARNHVLVEERVAEGAANLCALLPRDVLRPLLIAGAVQVVLVHNHPSGDPTPSAEDLDLTRRIGAAGELVGVGVMDHVIVGAGSWTSLLDEGLMEETG